MSEERHASVTAGVSAAAGAGGAALPRGVTGAIPPELLRLALPVLGSQMLRLGYQWVDALWVRGLGIEATAAVTTSIFVMWAVYSLIDVFGAGVAAYVSQLVGAGDRRRAGLAAYTGMRATAVLGLAVAVIGAPAARFIYEQMHVTAGVRDAGEAYLGIILAAAPLPMLGFTAELIMRAAGNTRVPLMLDFVSIAINAALDPLLIYGWGPFPRLGVAGAAWATVIAQAVLVASYAVVVWRGHPAFPFARSAEGPPIRVASLARVGVPTALIGIMFSLVYVAFARSAARYGAAAVAVVGVANRIEAIQFIVGAAIGSGCAALVGQNLGAGRPDRAVASIRTGLVWSASIASVLTVLILSFPLGFLAMFTQDPEALRLGVPYLRVLAVGLLATSVEMILAEAIPASGHTRALSVIYNVVSVLRVPLAFWIPDVTHSGVLGIAWVITSTCIARSVAIVIWAARGTWKRGLGRDLHATPVLESNPDARA